MTKIGCVVQGDLRVSVLPILRELRRHCDLLVLSTWEDQRERAPEGDWFRAVYNTPPAVRGITNRNLQRCSTAAGLALAESEGCSHILKWRTDMLPTHLRREDLLRWAAERPVAGLPGRIVMSAFRNLSVIPDWFSSFPDQFAFGELSAMKLLWGDDDFNYTRDHNLPRRMVTDCRWEATSGSKVRIGGTGPEEIAEIYDAHVEFYALFRERLSRQTGRDWTHEQIVRDVLRPINHRRLHICWLNHCGRIPFRSVRATTLPWWTETDWYHKLPVTTVTLARRHQQVNEVEQMRNRVFNYWEILHQCLWYSRFRFLN